MKSEASPILALHEMSLYNTGRLSPEQVVAAFAARGPLLERLIGDLAAEKPKGRPQHHLIVGQRGMGKTMLLARIAAELRTNDALATRFLPVVFAEEQYAVDRLSKFWLNCLDSLADASEWAGDPAAVEAIDREVERLTKMRALPAKEDQPFADEVYAVFAKAVAATGRRPVLLVDNLQIVFERLETGQQHSLRELLMRAGAPILVGASPSPPPQSQDYGAAFYDHFKVHYLRPLEESEMRELILHLADRAGREDVRERVLRHPERLKVLRQLTGGNPRTTLTLFFLYAEDFAPSVFGDLEGLLDRVTPLYKARFEELTDQQQVIASAIANHWDPVTAVIAAERTALPQGTISAQLDRLEKSGTIERVDLFGESRTGYQIAERFFNIWFLMRSASRRQRREVEFLTRFLERFDEPGNGRDEAGAMRGEPTVAEGIRIDNTRIPEEILPVSSITLRNALSNAYDANWGLAREGFAMALRFRPGEMYHFNTDDWLRASAVLIHLNYGEQLLAFLDERGDTARFRPWVEAIRAVQIGDRRALQNIAPEIRTTAEVFYDGIERRLVKLPEKTNRRPKAPAKKARSRRK
jgi:hypothetical protein